jgi:hypothetical protein
MPTPRKNQKQIAQKYAGNRRYFRNLNPFRRARMLFALVVLVAAAVAGWFYVFRAQDSHQLQALDTTGGISQAHNAIAKDCKACHAPVASVDPLHPVVGTALDANCEKCHTQHTFHVADTTVDHSCIDCHHEHLGTGSMQQVKDVNCTSCHGSADIMAASIQKGATLPASAFEVVPKDNLLIDFKPPRPANGYTQVFQSFDNGHPDFQIQREHLTDPNTLKFNHKLHLTGDIPMVDGKKLDCAYCHKPDNHGAYMQPINFGKNCQACHSLQIDPTLADFQLPHPEAGGQANSVRDFLLTLPTQYASYAMQKKGLTNATDVAAFVNQHMLGMRERVREGADLEKDVFFSDATTVRVSGPNKNSPQERALFPGCAYCHEVKAMGGGEPVITKPVTPDRWYVHAHFDHSAHSTMSCEACHNSVFTSEKTSDVNLPDKASCVTCHSAKGGVVATCATCHDFHNKPATNGVAAASALRQMMLGQQP